MIVLIPVVVAVIGILMWALCTNPLLKEMGRMLFGIGAFVAVFRSGSEMVNLLR